MEPKEFDAINVIPFIDIMLVLLTIVLTTSTFIASGAIRVSLPAATATRDPQLKTLTVTIDRAGTVYLFDRPVSLVQLGTGLTGLDPATPVLIRADRDLPLQFFVDVIDRVKGLGFRQVSLQTQAG